ncbi:Ig-like domain-containing protein [soil metagenome]
MFTRLFQFLFSQSPQTFAKGKLIFTSPLPGEVRLLLTVACAALVFWLYRAAKVGPRRWLLALRFAIVGLLMLILGAPALRVQEPNKSKLFTAVLVDTSRSMSIADVKTTAGLVARLSAARDALLNAGDKGIVPQLSESSQVILYAFSDQIHRATAADLAEANGSRTDLFQSIRSVDADLRNVPLGAVVLVTDGGRNTGGAASDAAKLLEARGVPLYVLGVGDPTSPRDLEVVQVLAPAQVPAGSQVDLDVTVRHTGFDQPFDLILKRGDETILTKNVVPEPGSDLQRLRLTFTPDHQGAAAYHLEIPPAKEETITQNNAKDFLLEVKDDRLPVLYVEGSPRMEYRFLRRAIFRDPTFRLVGLLRLNTDRFYLQGAGPNEADLKNGFPDSLDKLAAFKALILGDIEAAHFTPQQLQMIEDFVKIRGGGLLMLGGVNSFGPGGYANTPVGNALPVTMSSKDEPYSDQQFTAQILPSVLDHPVMRLSLDPVENKSIWDNAPPLIGVTPVQSVKPGATLLLQKPDTRNPVLAVQNYGQGRTAAFTSGGSWYWQMSRPASDEFHEKFWKQLVRWLAVGAKDMLTVSTDASVYSRRDPVTISASVMGKDLRPLNDAHVTATITDALGNAQTLPMDWILSEEGVYQCRFVPDQQGQYQVKVAVEGWDSPPAQSAFVVSESSLEFADASLKRDLLKEMADVTHGRYFDLDQAGEMPAVVREGMQTTALATTVPQDHPIWDMPILLIIAISLVGTEWLIRRRSGLS